MWRFSIAVSSTFRTHVTHFNAIFPPPSLSSKWQILKKFPHQSSILISYLFILVRNTQAVRTNRIYFTCLTITGSAGYLGRYCNYAVDRLDNELQLDSQKGQTLLFLLYIVTIVFGTHPTSYPILIFFLSQLVGHYARPLISRKCQGALFPVSMFLKKAVFN